MSRISGYGFSSREKAKKLSHIADTHGVERPPGLPPPRVKYAVPLPQGRGVFAVNLNTLSHASFCTVQRLTRKADDTGWELTTGTTNEDRFTAYDIFLNTGESIARGYVMYVVLYEGYPTVEMIYCKAADWLDVTTLPPP